MAFKHSLREHHARRLKKNPQQQQNPSRAEVTLSLPQGEKGITQRVTKILFHMAAAAMMII